MLLGFVLRVGKDFSDPRTLKSLYCAIVRPVLEFASIIWIPTQKYRIERLELIQRKFTRILWYRLNWSRDATYPCYRTRFATFWTGIP